MLGPGYYTKSEWSFVKHLGHKTCKRMSSGTKTPYGSRYIPARIVQKRRIPNSRNPKAGSVKLDDVQDRSGG